VIFLLNLQYLSLLQYRPFCKLSGSISKEDTTLLRFYTSYVSSCNCGTMSLHFKCVNLIGMRIGSRTKTALAMKIKKSFIQIKLKKLIAILYQYLMQFTGGLVLLLLSMVSCPFSFLFYSFLKSSVTGALDLKQYCL